MDRREIRLDMSTLTGLFTLALAVALPAHTAAQAPVPRQATATPTLVDVTVTGTTRIPEPVVVDLVALEVRQPLTTGDLLRATNRLDLLPATLTTRLRYDVGSDRRATVAATVTERPRYPTAVPDVAGIATRVLFSRELRADFAHLLNRGDLMTAGWRWSRNRPRVQVLVGTPAPGRLPGVMLVEGLWERATYRGQLDPAFDALVQRRRRVAVALEDWALPWLRWNGGVAYDAFDGRSFVSVSGVLDVRAAADHVAVVTEGGTWTGPGSAGRFHTLTTYATARTATEPTDAGWMARVGTTVVSDAAPLALWPGAGSTLDRGIWLRAHRLHKDGTVTSDVFGRSVGFGTVEYQRPIRTGERATLALVGLADAARATRRLGTDEPSRLLIDVGAGLRVYLPTLRGAIRTDLAYGLRDDRFRVSVSFVNAWPRR